MPTEITTPLTYIAEGGKQPIAGRSTATTAFIGWTPQGPAGQPLEVRSFVDVERLFGGLDTRCPFAHSLLYFFENGGSVARVLRLADEQAPDEPLLPGTDAYTEALDRPTGLAALDSVDFNLMCAPGETRAEVLAKLQRYCHSRRAFLVADAPRDATLTTLSAGVPAALAGPESANTALYWPWVLAPDPLAGNANAVFPPSGFVAGIYARTDTARGVWKAPAGVDAYLYGATGLTAAVTDSEQGVLNAAAINVLREFPAGRVVWGSRTLLAGSDSTSQWKYVPVRRLALYVESSIDAGLDWVVFESNGEPLWARVRLKVGEFMESMFRAGALQGVTAKDAFFVKCDPDTMSADDIGAGLLNVMIGFAALKPAEFIVLRIQKKTLAPGLRDVVSPPLPVTPAVPASPALPVKVQGPDLNAAANEVGIETLQLEPEGIAVAGSTNDPATDEAALVAPDAIRAVLAATAAQLRAVRKPGAPVLIVGPAGSGKTMAARVLADQAGLHLYRVDLAAAVSRYIGETEKNLERSFEHAARTGSVLLIDEADALFGARTEVRDAHDRYANLEAAWNWIRKPRWPPVFIECGEAAGDLAAKESAASRVIRMPAPDRDARIELWRRALPGWSSLDARSRERLADIQATGGAIRAAVQKATEAAGSNEARGGAASARLGAGANAEPRKTGGLDPAQLVALLATKPGQG